MDTIDGTSWDIVVIGTDLQQSLLALALSRSGRKVLHIDKNEYYGGSDAAVSLQEAEAWVDRVNKDALSPFFRNATISRPDPIGSPSSASKLSFPRAYSLALSPYLIYSLSTLLPVLISSKVYRQLDFLAIGSWWVYTTASQGVAAQTRSEGESKATEHIAAGSLTKVPNGREDVFSDKTVDVRAKRQLMKFLRFAVKYDDEDQVALWEPHRSKPFPEFLAAQFGLPASLQESLLALTFSQRTPTNTSTAFALPRVARHLRSIGIFGPGFGSLTPKWGGLAEVAQVACRAGAVGGGVYVLDKSVTSIAESPASQNGEGQDSKELSKLYTLHWNGGETVSTDWIVGLEGGFPSLSNPSTSELSTWDESVSSACHVIAIVSSPLTSLFPSISESGPASAGAVVIFPAASSVPHTNGSDQTRIPPVHAIVHSSDTGECPTGQCIVYASTSLTGEAGLSLLDRTILRLLQMVDENPLPSVLWSMRYEQRGGVVPHSLQDPQTETKIVERDRNILRFPPPSLDLVFDDSMVDRVKDAWQKIMGADAQGFMTFEDREGAGDMPDDYDDGA